MSLGSDSARDPHIEDYEGVPGTGSIVAGKYRVERTLGVGGMGVVVAARHLQLNNLVAIKFLHEKGNQRGAGARFLREARAAAALTSEHVARVIDVDALESGSPFIVMEYLEGTSLTKVIRKRSPLPVTETVDLMLQACDALREAHARGIVHRDIKPSNMFLLRRSDGTTLLKVLDFGISKAPGLTDAEEPTLTESHAVLGSPQYLSPEQIVDVRTVDHRTDVWSLGVVLYYMLSGQRPFEEETVAALCVAIATTEPIRLRVLRPDLPHDVEAAVMGCLDKDRDLRVQSAAELARLLAPYSSRGPRALQDLPPLGPNSGVVASDAPSSLRVAPPGTALAEVDRLALPMAPTERLIKRGDDTRNGVLVHAAHVGPPRPATALWLPIAVALAAVTVVAVLLAVREPEAPPHELGGVAPVASGGPTSESAGEVPQGQGDRPGPRSVLLPGSARPVASAPPKPTIPDLTHLGGSGWIGTAQAPLRLLDRLGGKTVIGVVPAGEIVKVNQVAGEWALVTHVNEGRAVTGWTLRNLVMAPE
jgi:serine/threonine-protein kinase